ncbi:hypothetical protein HLK59_13275 [Streptomyces sp. S3(2020)]|uniref:hypothetical protein n=1 Tax=Streptomyces sp. S3(2020) TaxID=2732044 RepID=UPI0014877355|nr:hypothetical protein [Streptomyces sp. S3(2020)]NNN31321.1 hypothetical protein [Streptomyces sp. S3(2020)]
MTISEGSVTDALFGPLTVRLNSRRGEVVVEGEAIPRVVLSRANGTKADEHTPIGTRDAGLLILTVGGEAAALAPGRGRLIRRSYRVDVRHAGRHWRLVPDSMPDSRLLRDGRRLGDFHSKGDGRVAADWRSDAKPDAMDAAVGYALAAAFGTGAESMWTAAVDSVFDAFP